MTISLKNFCLKKSWITLQTSMKWSLGGCLSAWYSMTLPASHNGFYIQTQLNMGSFGKFIEIICSFGTTPSIGSNHWWNGHYMGPPGPNLPTITASPVELSLTLVPVGENHWSCHVKLLAQLEPNVSGMDKRWVLFRIILTPPAK